MNITDIPKFNKEDIEKLTNINKEYSKNIKELLKKFKIIDKQNRTELEKLKADLEKLKIINKENIERLANINKKASKNLD